jgi:hypothetical protein
LSVNTRIMSCSPDDVFAVLADGWLFPVWVVGASRMREVDAAWPAINAKLHHSFGVWPMLINDDTTMVEYDPPRHLMMQPKGWPIGEARVTIDVKPHRKGCVVRIQEMAVKGPGVFFPKPLLDIGLYLRNVETLRRLSFVAEGRTTSKDSL